MTREQLRLSRACLRAVTEPMYGLALHTAHCDQNVFVGSFLQSQAPQHGGIPFVSIGVVAHAWPQETCWAIAGMHATGARRLASYSASSLHYPAMQSTASNSAADQIVQRSLGRTGANEVVVSVESATWNNANITENRYRWRPPASTRQCGGRRQPGWRCASRTCWDRASTSAITCSAEQSGKGPTSHPGIHRGRSHRGVHGIVCHRSGLAA